MPLVKPSSFVHSHYQAFGPAENSSLESRSSLGWRPIRLPIPPPLASVKSSVSSGRRNQAKQFFVRTLQLTIYQLTQCKLRTFEEASLLSDHTLQMCSIQAASKMYKQSVTTSKCIGAIPFQWQGCAFIASSCPTFKTLFKFVFRDGKFTSSCLCQHCW
jgi:hypothetical protein